MTNGTNSTVIVRSSVASGVLRVSLFWALAAAALIMCDRVPELHGLALYLVKTTLLVVVAALYMNFSAPDPTIDHALFVGVAWLMASVTAELIAGSLGSHGFSALLGSPDSPWRNLLMIGWVTAPALFARPPVVV